MSKKGLTAKSNTNSSYTFLSIMQDSFREKVASGTPGSEERKNKNDEMVSEMIYGEAVGMLTRAFIREGGDYGKELSFTIAKDGESYVIQTGISSGYASGFFSRMLAIDITKEVRVVPYYIEKDLHPGKFNAILSFYQKDEKGAWVLIPTAYTKDAPNGCPEMKKVVVNGEERWDSTDRLNFFEAKLAPLTDTLEGMYRTAKVAPATPTADLETIPETEAPVKKVTKPSMKTEKAK